VSGTCKSGFTLIEILIAMAIVALIAVAVAPNLSRRTPEYERKQLISQLNSFTQLAWHQAMATGKVHKIIFNLGAQQVELQRETNKKADNGEALFEPIPRLYFSQSFAWPPAFQIKQFIVEGSDLMDRYVGRSSDKVWFFVIPEGLTQAVTINLFDTKDLLQNKKPRPVGLVLNPFSAQFSVYDQFQK
jgi:prepilin-type N-terminal cleavage/methylation domain-containing protein